MVVNISWLANGSSVSHKNKALKSFPDNGNLNIPAEYFMNDTVLATLSHRRTVLSSTSHNCMHAYVL